MTEEAMGLTTVAVDGLTFVEGAPHVPLFSSASDITSLLEACFASQTRSTLLYAENLPASFFDLSSHEAGTVLQRLRNYGVRLAIVLRPDSVPTSHRFAEMVAEERRGRAFGLFETRADALEWLGE